MKFILALILLMGFTSYAYADDVRFIVTFPIIGGKVQQPYYHVRAYEFEANIENKQLATIQVGFMELNKGTWSIPELNKSRFDFKVSPRYNDADIAAIRSYTEGGDALNDLSWLRGRMVRQIPHKDCGGGSIPPVATEQEK